MGEPERRRRRLRSSDSPAGEDRSAEPLVAGDQADDTRIGGSPAGDPASGAIPARPGLAARPIPRPTSGAGTGAGFRSAPATGPRPAFGRSPAGERPTSGAGVGTDEREAERGLRGLVGSGSSQVSVGAALRARDAARPTDAQLAEAEERLVIVRRNWAPREDLPRR